MREIRVPACAKINLRLHILGRRPDGFHELRTIFQTVSLHDELYLRVSHGRGISLAIQGNDALSHEPVRDNLVYRAVDALRRELKIRSGLEILLKKKIPAGRGLGGGSSDAAAALMGVLRLSGRKIPRSALMRVAASLGSDVPFFLFGGCALGIGRGDELYPLPDVPKRAILIVSPKDIHVATPDAYRWLRAPELSPAPLTKYAPNHKLLEFCALCWSARGDSLSNDFEGPVFQRYPRLRKIKRDLLRRGATEASLAGSGSAVFGVFPSPALARRAAVGFPDDQVFVCETLSRGKYLPLAGRVAMGASAG